MSHVHQKIVRSTLLQATGEGGPSGGQGGFLLSVGQGPLCPMWCEASCWVTWTPFVPCYLGLKFMIQVILDMGPNDF